MNTLNGFVTQKTEYYPLDFKEFMLRRCKLKHKLPLINYFLPTGGTRLK